MFNPQRILVTTDFSGESVMALQEAADIAKRFGSEIYLLHVIPTVEQCGGDACLDIGVVLAEQQKLEREARARMSEEISAIASADQARITADIRFGRVSDEIVNEERERAIDLVVTAPHHRTWRRGRPWRHLTERLVRESPIETLVVKGSVH